MFYEITVADPVGAGDTPMSKFLHFHAVFGKKIGQIVGWRPLGIGTTSLGNPGSATGKNSVPLISLRIKIHMMAGLIKR